MADQFPIVIRGYDKEQVDRAFASAQQTLAALRAQIKQDGDRLLQLQAKLQEERNRQSSKNHTFASLGANAQQMLASAEQTSTELLERAKQDAASTRASAKAQAETLINNAKLDAQHLLDDAQAKADTITGNATNQAQTITTSAQQDGEDRDRAASVRRSRTHQFARGA